ncbi:hypothetical protein T05_3008 [Trichinella murrelli]|uniref:Uncharacterized protein n=1 Tax=Trichinella murrelli TaxID=144512 RepID=A0A0V0TIQ4_9BILA|nr:hypothetical protein T05_3008 [Trichinella murrelli]
MIKDEIFRIYDFEFFSNKSNSFKWKESRLKKWKEGFTIVLASKPGANYGKESVDEFENLITSRACESDRFQKRTNLYDISIIGEAANFNVKASQEFPKKQVQELLELHSKSHSNGDLKELSGLCTDNGLTVWIQKIIHLIPQQQHHQECKNHDPDREYDPDYEQRSNARRGVHIYYSSTAFSTSSAPPASISGGGGGGSDWSSGFISIGSSTGGSAGISAGGSIGSSRGSSGGCFGGCISEPSSALLAAVLATFFANFLPSFKIPSSSSSLLINSELFSASLSRLLFRTAGLRVFAFFLASVSVISGTSSKISCKMFTFVISFISLNVKSKPFVTKMKKNVDYTSYSVDEKAN